MSEHSKALPRLAVVASVVAVAAVIGVVMWLSRADESPGALDRTSAEQSSADASVSPEPSPTTPEEPPDPAPTEAAPPEPKSVDVGPSVRAAQRDGVAALLPDRLRSGWGMTRARYSPSGDLWHLEVTMPDGVVDLYQAADASSEALLREHAPGAERGKDVDLRAWYLGTWSSWTSPGRAAVATDLPVGGVVVVGDDLAPAVEVAKTLLTYENVGGGEQD